MFGLCSDSDVWPSGQTWTWTDTISQISDMESYQRRSSSSRVVDHWMWPPPPPEHHPASLSHPEECFALRVSPVKRWCLDVSSAMKGSEASSLALVLSTLCLLAVSLHLPRWLGTITGQRHFLNVLSGAERSTPSPPSGGPLAARVRGRDPRDRPCGAATQEDGWLISKARRMQVSIMTEAEYSAHLFGVQMWNIWNLFAAPWILTWILVLAPPPRAYHHLMTTSAHQRGGGPAVCLRLFMAEGPPAQRAVHKGALLFSHYWHP